MDREWFTLRLLQIDIAVLVVVVLVGIAVITSRLARDPSDSIVRWWQERGRMAAPLAERPVGMDVRVAIAAAAESVGPAKDFHIHTPEWLERLVGRHHGGDEQRPAANVQVSQEPASGRRVA